MELVEMSLGQVISEPGCDLGFAYFPLTAIVSLLYVMNDGESAEIALVGNDGVLGITLFMGGNSTTIRAVVQSAGMGYRLPASELVAEVARGGATLRLLLLYTQSLVTQMTQTAACNRHHTLNQQFSRWLLLSFDRLCGDEMVMTQKLISKMLGVTSDEVTSPALALSESGAIAYRRSAPATDSLARCPEAGSASTIGANARPSDPIRSSTSSPWPTALGERPSIRCRP